ncbi:MAG: hypothetical protein AAFQ83_12705, partial [Bacteroidota bacterium]
MDFEAFIKEKKIDPASFQAKRPKVWAAWRDLFAAIGAQSFDHQKKFEFNPLRRMFPLAFDPAEKAAPKAKAGLRKAPSTAVPAKSSGLKKAGLRKAGLKPT